MVGKFSELMEDLKMIDDAKSMEEELTHNMLLKRDLKLILSHITPYMPLIGLICGATIIGKHVFSEKPETTEDKKE